MVEAEKRYGEEKHQNPNTLVLKMIPPGTSLVFPPKQ
jgi:hypothetical protein